MDRFPTTSWGPGDEAIEERLEQAEVTDAGQIGHASNHVFLLELAHPNVEERGYAVYKPLRGETPLWDFPPQLYKREVASYRLSKALGWALIPPTVAREEGVAEGMGSLQLFIPADYRCTYFDLRHEHTETMRRFAVSAWLANNADRKGGHILQGPDDQLWGIDNGLTFHSEEKLRTVIWDYAGEAVSESELTDVAAFAARLAEDAALGADLGRYLDEEELGALRARAAEILEQRRFPEPPTWRRPYPWPLI